MWMFSLSTSMQCKYCFYPLRKADMLTPHLFCSLAPSILPTPNIHGFIDCRSRAAVKGEWKVWRPQRTGHFPWTLDRHKLGGACLVTFSRWLASTLWTKIQTLTCHLIGLHLITPYFLLPVPLHLNSPFISSPSIASFLCLSFSF